ncbi:glycerophosphoryl diester phosphodiesterase membrane domain-containing protein [Desmospora activa]|uniref:glycerophosphoryl diester phosphodiesterase membrane domain-containing protein n=1 Tax=Desmospora activa TaxID=500615 RepID=UPI001475F70F|nr:glycerophosphoryl diester phosphodiesterase membrane domain-containing protein [Desmospora activa]
MEHEASPLRRWGFLEIIDGTFQVFRTRFVPLFFSVFLLIGLFQFVFNLLNLQLSETLEPLSDPFLDPMPADASLEPFGWGEAVLMALMTGGVLVTYIFLYPLMRVAVSWITVRNLIEEQAVTTGEALKRAWKTATSALLTHWLAGAIVLGGLVVIAALVFLPFSLLGIIAGEWVVTLILSGIVFLLLILPLLLWVLIRLSLLFPVIVEEQTSYFAALKRSWSLTRRSFWRLFAFFLFVGTILFGVTGIMGVVLQLLLMWWASIDWTYLWIGNIIVALVLTGLTCLLEAGLGVLATVLYVDQRIRLEGVDLELAFRISAGKEDGRV